MATTGRTVFDLAIVLIDEMSDSGVISDGVVKSYLVKAPSLLSIIEMDLAMREGLETPNIITDLSQPLTISDQSARMIMPYGLAAHFVLEENADTASFYNQKFEELKRRVPRGFTKITDAYCGGDYGWL